MGKRSFNVTAETLGDLESLITMHLLDQQVYFDGHVLYLSNDMALGSGYVKIFEPEMIGIVAVSIPYAFAVEDYGIKRELVIPILQPLIPEFNVSTVTVDDENMIIIASHVSDQRKVQQKFGFSPRRTPFGFMVVRLILNEGLVKKIS